MATPAILISLFGLLVLGGGIIGIRESDSEDDASGMAFVIATGAAGLGLLFGGIGVLIRKDLASGFYAFCYAPAYRAFRLPCRGDRGIVSRLA